MYPINEDEQTQAALIDSLIENLSGNSVIWQVTDIFKADAKKKSGAVHDITRHVVSFNNKHPVFLRTNVNCYSLPLQKETLYILPDKLLIVQGNTVGAIDWREMKIDIAKTSFIEDSPPSDALVTGKTWKYVNKDGSRDKRFSGNYERFTCSYGKIEFKTNSGFNTTLYVSDIKKALIFQEVLVAGVSGGV